MSQTGWSTLAIDDFAGLESWLAVMLAMDPSYAGMTIDDVRWGMQSAQGQVFFYQGSGFQISLRFGYEARRGGWQWVNLGFVGSVTAAQALDLSIGRFHQFLADQQVASVTAVVPKSVAYAPLMQLYGLAQQDPRLHITVLYESDSAYVWQIEYIGM
jgi:hypothetical protein